jgi:hypothetical protein
MVAVKVTEPPNVDGVPDVATVKVGVALLTTCVIALEVTEL